MVVQLIVVRPQYISYPNPISLICKYGFRKSLISDIHIRPLKYLMIFHMQIKDHVIMKTGIRMLKIQLCFKAIHYI